MLSRKESQPVLERNEPTMPTMTDLAIFLVILTVLTIAFSIANAND